MSDSMVAGAGKTNTEILDCEQSRMTAHEGMTAPERVTAPWAM
jgi:hypothetical protein